MLAKGLLAALAAALLMAVLGCTTAATGQAERNLVTEVPTQVAPTAITNNEAADRRLSWSPDSRRIAFQSNQDGDWDIYVVNADGSEVTQITKNFDEDATAVWSPDGDRIAFVSDRNDDARGTYDIYVTNTDGSEIVQLTSNGGQWPAWSPDGRRISFVSYRCQSQKREIPSMGYCVMNADGSDANRITSPFGHPRLSVWSPDSSQIMLTEIHGGSGISVVNADGSGKGRKLTNLDSERNGLSTDWSPDGRLIAFEAKSNFKKPSAIYVMNVDSTDVTQITNHSSDSWRPIWSPDGRRILFLSNRDGGNNIYVMNADGSEVVQLTSSGGARPAWSPDGQRIAFESSQDGDWDIYVVDAPP